MMRIRKPYIPLLAVALMVPSSALGKKKPLQKAMLENMQAVPCGAKERGLTGLGSVFASAGITAVNSNEKLCPQYLLRTDDMEYRIRPTDTKHAVLLPVGEEGEFRLKKNKLMLRAGDRDRKLREYQVVSMQPRNTGQALEGSTYRAPDSPVTAKPTPSSVGNVAGKTPYPPQ